MHGGTLVSAVFPDDGNCSAAVPHEVDAEYLVGLVKHNQSEKEKILSDLRISNGDPPASAASSALGGVHLLHVAQGCDSSRCGAPSHEFSRFPATFT